MGADKGLAMIKEIAISFFADSYLFLKLFCLRDAYCIDYDLLQTSGLIEYGENPVLKMLHHSFSVHGGLGPLHYPAGTPRFFEDHASCTSHGRRTAGILAKLLIGLADHPFPEMLLGYGARVNVQKPVVGICHDDLGRNKAEDVLKKLALQGHA